jgi:phosphatidylserine decarboxylase
LNVFTQNKRAVLELQTEHSQFPVLFVAVGALLVGSIAFTVQEGEKVVKGEELGYFAYGGSTVIVLFPDDMGVEFDEDVAEWSKQGVETLLSVGSGVAKANK